MKKILWKIVAAVVIIALPFALASCSKDEEKVDNGPWKFSYKWSVDGLLLDKITDDEVLNATIKARGEINKLIASAFEGEKFIDVDITNKTFTTPELTVNDDSKRNEWDAKVKRAWSNLQPSNDFQDQLKLLPEDQNPTLTIWRIGKEEPILRETLKY